MVRNKQEIEQQLIYKSILAKSLVWIVAGVRYQQNMKASLTKEQPILNDHLNNWHGHKIRQDGKISIKKGKKHRVSVVKQGMDHNVSYKRTPS